MMRISVADDFTKFPGARYISEGEFSGEKFREEKLYPQYLKAVEKGEKLIVDLDGCYGFATSFLEESFGGLVRKLKVKGIMKIITIISEEDKSLVELINQYVEDAEKKL